MRVLLTGVFVLALAACGGHPAESDGGHPKSVVDAGSHSTGTTDGGSDGGASDAGVPDAGVPDAGSPDAGSPDAGTLSFGGGDWSYYRGDLLGTWDHPGTLTAADGRTATLLWSASLGAYGLTQPMLAGGAVYVATGFDARVVKLDAATGAVLWEKDFDHVFTPTPPCSSQGSHTGFFAAPAVVGDTVYAAAPDGRFYALAASDGAVRWSVQVADPSLEAHDEFVESSPSRPDSKGRIYLGIASVYGCDPVVGKVLAVDVNSHTVQSQPITDGGLGGASVWSSIAVEDTARRLFVSTGDPAGHALDTLPFSQAILRMDADTLEVQDHWQNPTPPPSADSDFGASPTLFQASDGTPLVAAPNKDGWLYAFNRDDLAAGPRWTYALAQGGDPMQGFGSLAAPTFAQGRLYAAGGRTLDGKPGSVVALDPGTGAVLWRHDPPGYVMPAMPAVGDVLVVASNAANNNSSTLELLDLVTGEVLAHFEAGSPTYGAPSIGHGLILWSTFDGTLRAIQMHPTP